MYYPAYVQYGWDRNNTPVHSNIRYVEDERFSPVLPFVAGLAGGSLIGFALANKPRPPIYPVPPPMVPYPPPYGPPYGAPYGPMYGQTFNQQFGPHYGPIYGPLNNPHHGVWQSSTDKINVSTNVGINPYPDFAPTIDN